jgi:hypothetical protein
MISAALVPSIVAMALIPPAPAGSDVLQERSASNWRENAVARQCGRNHRIAPVPDVKTIASQSPRPDKNLRRILTPVF